VSELPTVPCLEIGRLGAECDSASSNTTRDYSTGRGAADIDCRGDGRVQTKSARWRVYRVDTMRERTPDDPRALVAHLFDVHGAALYRYAVMLLADPSAAEDALQQVFAALLRPSVRVEGPDPLRYLRRAVRNECYSLLRRRRLRQGDEEAGPLLEAVAESPPPEERLALERSIRGLPSDQREVIHLHVFEGLTFREIASETSESINTIASRYRYAIGRLRQQLDGLGQEKGRV